MYLEDTISKAQRVEASRRPLSGRESLSSRNNDCNHDYEKMQYQRTGSSLKNLFARTMSFKRSNSTVGTRCLTPQPESSYELPTREQDCVGASTSMSLQVATSASVNSGQSPSLRTECVVPPLFQAYLQALKCAVLDAPSTSRQMMGRRWTKQLYILVTNGCILQYAAAGPHDRLPQQILQLGCHSVAFASDDIPGKPYVLQILRNPNQEHEPVDASTRRVLSRIGFRGAEDKRAATTLLLICENAEELETWMEAVRKAIEYQRGAQYRPEAAGADHNQAIQGQEPEQQCQLRQNARQGPRRRPTALAKEQTPDDTVSVTYELLPEIKTLSGLWSEQSFFDMNRSSQRSSVNTITDLDDLRGSSPAYTSTSTATEDRLSLRELSPAGNEFSDTYIALTGGHPASVPATHSEDYYGPPNINNAPARSIVPSEPVTSSGPSTVGRPASVVPNFSLRNLSQRYSRCSLIVSETSSVVTSEGCSMANIEEHETGGLVSDKTRSKRPTSHIAPLPSREAMTKKPRSRVSTVENWRPPTCSGVTMPRPIPTGCKDVVRTKAVHQPSYTMSPNRRSSSDPEQSFHQLATTGAGLNSLTVGGSHHRSFSMLLDLPASLPKVHSPGRMRRPVSMQICLRGSFEVEQPARSPAVTDMHFATNFGTTTDPFKRSNNSGSGTLPELLNLMPRTDFFSRSIRASAMSARRKAALNSAIGLPAGPPPRCPLPPLPPSQVHDSSVPVSSSRWMVTCLTKNEY